MKNDNPSSDNALTKIRNYSLRIGERLYKRLSKHIQLLKHLRSIKNQQEWLEKAILTKIKKEEEQDTTKYFSPEKYLSFKISSQLDVQVEKRVEIMKKIRGNFSKKQWVLEAIYERLEAEEAETEARTKELFNNILREASAACDTSNISST